MKRVLFFTLVAASLVGTGYAQGAKRGAAEGTIQGKRVAVDYGQVELRGRSLDSLIALLPDDRVWRAGVDEVTTLTTQGDLFVDGLCGSSCSRNRSPSGRRKVPAGRYSVYVSVPQQGDWLLILNSDPGIELGALAKALGFLVPESAAKRLWPHLEGYNLNREKHVSGIADKEVARVTMRPGIANPPVDPFTVSLSASGSNALTMTLAWADKSWSVDLNGPM